HDDPLGGLDDLRRPLAGGDGDRTRPRDAGVSVEQVDAVRAEERADATRELLDDPRLPVLQLVRIDARVVDEQAEARPTLHLLVGVARRNDRLARHAAPVQAYAADFVLLDADDLLLELGKAYRTRIAARPAADDDCVVSLVGHGICFFSP